MLINFILTLIFRHANLPYSYLNYPSCKSPLCLLYLSGMLISLILDLIIRNANLHYSCINYLACKSPLFLT